MQSLPENLQVTLSNYTCQKPGNENRVIPCLRVVIAGTPSVTDVNNLMKNLREITDNISEKYIAITDLTNLQVSKFFRSFIMFGMEKAYKSFLSVKNQAAISFVILGPEQRGSRQVTDSLLKINSGVSSKDYNYRYFFLEYEKKVQELVKQYFEF